MDKDRLYNEYLRACEQEGCPVCRLLLEAMHRYMDNVMYEYICDVPARQEMRDARGYCNEHAWYLPEGYGRLLGIAIIHEDIIGTALKAVDAARERRWPARQARTLLSELEATAECPACIQQRKLEAVIVNGLLEYLPNDEFRAALSASSGLCLRHFARVVDLCDDNDLREQVIALEEQALRAIRAELLEFIRKTDYRFHGEPIGDEGDSWLRAIGLVSGERRERESPPLRRWRSPRPAPRPPPPPTRTRRRAPSGSPPAGRH